MKHTVVDSIRDYHNIIFQLSPVKGWSAFCKSYLICKTLNEKCKASSSSSYGISKLALPPGGPGTRVPIGMFIPGLFWDLLLFLALREHLHDFISTLYALFLLLDSLLSQCLAVSCRTTWWSDWYGCLIEDRDFPLLLYALVRDPTHGPHWHVKLVECFRRNASS